MSIHLQNDCAAEINVGVTDDGQSLVVKKVSEE